ncbi:MAG: RNA-directed DNA polymerase [Candidatus Omnitrophota bacterium]|jgi:RNA-directed DNA polymerase
MKDELDGPRKPFSIPKQYVWIAYKRVKANQGACGVDKMSIEDLDRDRERNLYKLWNRMSSGTYFPPPVKLVEIPKKSGGMRPLGIPTVLDRIAQMVVKMILEVKVEPHFHPDSYAYRPKKSAIQAVGQTRRRCWRYAWAIDLDIKGFFDNLDHELLLKAVRHHTDSKWILLYIERWLKAKLQLKDKSLKNRDKGTPQGGVISPLLANLYLHYTIDAWMERTYPENPFERYADDIVVHAKTQEEATALFTAITKRLKDCGLEVNKQKTKIVSCENDKRQGNDSIRKFDFQGFAFQPRKTRSRKGHDFIGFNPGISPKSATAIRRTMRTWQLHRRNRESLSILAHEINPILNGWINYYGKYRKSDLYSVFDSLDSTIMRWVMRKYKRFRNRKRKARAWLRGVKSRDPRLFAHWQLGNSNGQWMIGAV